MAQQVGTPISLVALSNEELIHLWRVEEEPNSRNRIVGEVKKRKLFPDDEDNSSSGSLYPDVDDPNFVSRLLKKSEFADTYSPPLSAEESSCTSGTDFEVTPVQRFVANFLHPRTPYMSALLYHGVGVGKTCAAIQTAEAYLDVYPRRKVIIVAPPTIQAGFYRTIFDVENLRIGVGEALNSATGCTGDSYLRITGLINERNKEVIEKDIKKAIKSRYEFYGYLQFRNYIRSITSKVSKKGSEDDIRLREIDALKREFNYRLLIIDEAHNLRDVSSTGVVEDEEDTDTVGTEDEKEEAKAGKLLTPYLNQLLDSTDGMKLLLMTATPMFNSVLEIVHIFNLLLRNDKKATITQNQIMDLQGNLITGAEEIIKPIANAYVSFMRGENPNSFPLRLYPEGMDPRGKPVDRITVDNYPDYIFSVKNDKLIEVTDDSRERMTKLPLVRSESLQGSQSYNVMRALTQAGSKMGSNYMIIDSLLQAGNCVFPLGEESPDSFVGLKGFQNNFIKRGKGVISAKNASWLSEENIRKFSPKMATILQYTKHCQGVGFIYSRFVTAGALLMALILEANGYTMYGRTGLLEQGIQSEGGRQCALCSKREREHASEEHSFVPAVYVLLTGDKELSPNNKASINAARSDRNVKGGIVKVVIGSQIAGEGLDLRFIREVHILDAWFHLNKTEQIIGRGIRYRSHCLIEDIEKRNTTVFLHVLTLQDYENETADLYCYRSALLKAILAGQVSRALKIFAVDCNLRKDVTVLSGLGTRIQKDSQGQERNGSGDGILIDDMPYTAMCDWMECQYTCQPDVPINVETSNNSTYNAFSARYRETKIQKIIQKLFAQQAYYSKDDLEKILIDTGSPRVAINLTLQGILNNRLFRVTSGSREGYIIYKNGYFLFQPEVYKNTSIPLAIRTMDFPIRRDEFTPALKDKPVIEVVEDKEVESMSKDLWKHLVKWVNDVLSGKFTRIGIEIERHIEVYTTELSQQSKSYTDKLGMIVFLSKRIVDKDMLRSVILEYLWDEWLDAATQLSYYNSKDEEILNIATENITRSGSYEAFRYIDSQTNILKYICEDGQPCPAGVVDAFSKTDEPIKGVKAVQGKTGFMYGFVVPKTGNMVFKTHNPHKEGEKVSGGQECGNVASKDYVNKLKSISSEIIKQDVPITDFDEKNFYMKADRAENKKSIEISNSTQGCTLLNLVLRFMDKLNVDGKRWFFRPVSAYYSGHLGRITQEAKKTVKTEKKALKNDVKKQVKEEKKKPVATVTKKASTFTFKPKKTVVEVQAPVEAVQAPVEAVQAPVEAVQAPVEAVQAPVDAVQAPIEAVQESVSDTNEDELDELDEIDEVTNLPPKPIFVRKQPNNGLGQNPLNAIEANPEPTRIRGNGLGENPLNAIQVTTQPTPMFVRKELTPVAPLVIDENDEVEVKVPVPQKPMSRFKFVKK